MWKRVVSRSHVYPAGDLDAVARESAGLVDTITVGISDAPRPDEIVVILAIADGGRVNPRVGKGRIL